VAQVSKLGIYGGTFDPIHNGHLILAREALEQLQLDRVVFIPAALHRINASKQRPRLQPASRCSKRL
jgi:nicotinate-nucleotide adenylyltransferase